MKYEKRNDENMKPIQFNTEMVRSILDGQKTVTRLPCRITVNGNMQVEHQKCLTAEYPEHNKDGLCANFRDRDGFFRGAAKPTYHTGDILYVRETWSCLHFGLCSRIYVYHASDEPPFPDKIPFGCHLSESFKWHPSIHMPKEAARIFLRVTDVRVERLQEITMGDIEREGVWTSGTFFPREDFAELYDRSLSKKKREMYSWDKNPWVWVVTFERCIKPENL